MKTDLSKIARQYDEEEQADEGTAQQSANRRRKPTHCSGTLWVVTGILACAAAFHCGHPGNRIGAKAGNRPI